MNAVPGRKEKPFTKPTHERRREIKGKHEFVSPIDRLFMQRL